jgi:dephospho-CoA kinase
VLKTRPSRARPRPTTLPDRPRPVTVAITGGIGAGKTEMLKAFARRGAATISADEIVHRLLRDREVQAEIHSAFGIELTAATPEERARLGEAVFGHAGRVDKLERLLHPRVVREQQQWLTRVDASLAVVEVPLLYETGADARFDHVVVVTAPRDVRAARKDLSRLAERESRLIAEEEKVERADFVYVNDGSLDELDAFVEDVMRQLEAVR